MKGTVEEEEGSVIWAGVGKWDARKTGSAG